MRQFPIQFRAHLLKVPLVGAMVLYLKGPSCVSKCKQTMGHKKEVNDQRIFDGWREVAMKPKGQSADANFYYYEDATADVASMDSTAVYGNLADAMKRLYSVVSKHVYSGTCGSSPIA